MSDSFPSTPLSARTNTPGSAAAGATSGPSSGSRHLKRLSLSTASAFSPSSPASPLSATTASPAAAGAARSPATPGGERRGNHGVRGLRLSLSGSLPPSAGSPLGGAGAASGSSPTPFDQPDHPSSLGMSRAGSTSPTLLRRSIRPSGGGADTPSSAPGSPSLDGAAPGSAAALRSSVGRSGHARRTSSISYGPARSSLDGVSGLGLGGLAVGAEGEGTGAVSPAGRRSLDGGLGGVREEPEREEGEGPSAGGAAAVGDDVALARSRSASEGAVAQATLVEQNADLLSFIAKKERKCLDLREELKRHESELALLKKKWENIVARSLQQQSAPAPYHPRNASISTASSASPNTSPTPRSSAVLHPAHTAHSLDLSLLSSTFDPTDMDGSVAGVETPPIEIPESVKAAGSWLGNQLGRVIDAAVGFPSPVEERATNGLERLEEVDEEEEGEGEDGEEARSRRRESKGSSVETDFSSSAAGSRSTAPSSVASEETVSPPQPSAAAFETPLKAVPPKPTPQAPQSASPATSRQQRPYTPASQSLSQSQPPSSAPPAPSAAAASFLSQSHGPSSSHPNAHLSHSRSRSTALDALSGGWSSLNKKWTALSESETFRNSKRATMGLVDTFEQGLAQALGPLEPPRLDPIGGIEPQSPTRRAERPLQPHSHPSAPAQARGEIPSPFLAASPPTAAAAGGGMVAPALVPGQGLSTVFSSWSKSTNPAAAASTSSSSAHAALPPHASSAQAQPPSWDWSAFLPGSSSTDSGLNEAGSSPVKERRRSSVVREVKAAGAAREGGAEGKRQQQAPADEGEEWPAW
ncbi:hypothetical protein JCM6882_004056 [Rhodosporidiobolus microsporus]